MRTAIPSTGVAKSDWLSQNSCTTPGGDDELGSSDVRCGRPRPPRRGRYPRHPDTSPLDSASRWIPARTPSPHVGGRHDTIAWARCDGSRPGFENDEGIGA